MNRLTNVRTYLQFTQYREVKAVIFNGNSLMAMNSIKSQYGIKTFSVIREYKETGYLVEGTHSDVNNYSIT